MALAVKVTILVLAGFLVWSIFSSGSPSETPQNPRNRGNWEDFGGAGGAEGGACYGHETTRRCCGPVLLPAAGAEAGYRLFVIYRDDGQSSPIIMWCLERRKSEFSLPTDDPLPERWWAEIPLQTWQWSKWKLRTSQWPVSPIPMNCGWGRG